MITVRYFAAARAAAGVSEETMRSGEPGGTRLGDLVTLLAERHGDRLKTVLGAASFLVNGVGCRDHNALLPETAVVDVLPPFAGG
jgi:sulfur-carrier protein